MREIREKITALTQAYTDQLNLYKEIGEVGSQEGELIEHGQLDRLLQVLKTKEGLLRRAGEYEQQIRALQEQLVTHFELAAFSLLQLKLAAPEYYQDDLAALNAVVSEARPCAGKAGVPGAPQRGCPRHLFEADPGAAGGAAEEGPKGLRQAILKAQISQRGQDA